MIRARWLAALSALCMLGVFSAEGAEWKFSRRWQMTRHLKAVDFANAQYGVLAANRATAARTMDGGKTWRAFSMNSSLSPEKRNSTLTHVFLLDERVGFIAGENGVLFKTEDGGESWLPLRIAGAFGVLESAFFIDEQTGWVVGSGGMAYRTEDGGALGRGWKRIRTTICATCIFWTARGG